MMSSTCRALSGLTKLALRGELSGERMVELAVRMPALRDLKFTLAPAAAAAVSLAPFAPTLTKLSCCSLGLSTLSNLTHLEFFARRDTAPFSLVEVVRVWAPLR